VGKYLVRLAGNSINAFAADDYIAMLADLRQKRQIVAAMTAAHQAIMQDEDKAAQIASHLEAALILVSDADGRVAPVSMLKATTLALEQAHDAYQGETGDCIASGIPALDKILGGFYPDGLIILGGRPSMGKTGVALSIALNAARAGRGVVIASLEMNPAAMAMRALSKATAQSGHALSYGSFRRGTFTEQQGDRLKQVAEGVFMLPITFLAGQYSDIGALFAGARQVLRATGGAMRLLIVDYAQLLRSQAKSRSEQITEISIALKALSGQLNVPVIALSQLSRQVEQCDENRPMLSDLRDSGQPEQDADAVLFCYRDEYHLEREKPDDHDAGALGDWQAAMEGVRNRLAIIVTKQGQGAIGTAAVRFNPAINLVWEDGR
jgi:replicative DNA helicase